MTTFTFNNYDDTIDLRDVIERYEELEAEREALADHVADCEAANEYHNSDGEADAPEELDLITAKDDLSAWDNENGEEFKNLKTLLDDLKGYGGDEQWRGDWYPITLIRESYFTDYTEELVSDCYDLKGVPDFVCIDWEATARNVKVDYAEVDIDGVTYFYR